MILRKITTTFVFVIMLSFLLVQTVKADDCNEKMKERYTKIVHKEENDEKNNYIEIDCILSFYSCLNCENGYGNVDAQGNKLKFGTIAIPRELELGTKIKFDYFGDMIFTGTDRGSENHIRITEDGTYRIDVCIDRPNGYTDNQYLQYVNNMGKVETKGYILLY